MIFRVNVGKYTIHGVFGMGYPHWKVGPAKSFWLEIWDMGDFLAWKHVLEETLNFDFYSYWMMLFCFICCVSRFVDCSLMSLSCNWRGSTDPKPLGWEAFPYRVWCELFRCSPKKHLYTQQKLTWNLKMMVPKGVSFYRCPFSRFHVKIYWSIGVSFQTIWIYTWLQANH